MKIKKESIDKFVYKKKLYGESRRNNKYMKNKKLTSIKSCQDLRKKKHFICYRNFNKKS